MLSRSLYSLLQLVCESKVTSNTAYGQKSPYRNL